MKPEGIRKMILSFFVLTALSCGEDVKSAKTDSTESVQTPQHLRDSHSAPAISLPRTLNKEYAETIIAKHYSELNQQAGFIRYKGLGIAIGSITAVTPDTFSVNAEVNGRQVDSAGRDTTSKPFAKQHSFKAYLSGNNWSAQFQDK